MAKSEIKRKWMAALLGLMVASEAQAACVLDLDPKRFSPQLCSGLSADVSSESLQALKDLLARLYHSADVQTQAASCAQFGQLVKSVCKPLKPVRSSFVSADKTSRRASVASQVYDYRLVQAPSDAQAYYGFDPYAYNYWAGGDCKEGGKSALTLTPQCGQVHRCEPNTYNYLSYRGANGTRCTLEGSAFVCRDAVTGEQLVPVPVTENRRTIRSYRFFGACADENSRKAIEYDLAYVGSQINQVYSSQGSPVECSASSSSCLLLNVPLLQQDSTDLKRLLSRKTGIVNPADVGFCAPTSLAMLLAGLRNQTRSSLGGIMDSGASYSDPVDGAQSQNWAAATFRAGQMLGTDWWVGGTSTLQYKALLQNNLGASAGLLDSFMGTTNDYSNQNFINFTNGRGGVVQLSLSMDTTGGASEFHSLLVAGHAGGHLRVMDPWGRMYLVDIAMQDRNAIFYRIENAMFNYADPTRTVFTVSDSQYTATYTFASPPAVGNLYPAWWWSSDNSRLAIGMFEAVGAVTKVVRTGTAVPTVRHISGDQGFVYFSPQNQAQLLPATEIAAVSPGPGVFFDAAESQIVQDNLYGIGQRVRGVWAAKFNRAPSDAEYNAAVQGSLARGGWLGTIARSAEDIAQANPTPSPTPAPSSSPLQGFAYKSPVYYVKNRMITTNVPTVTSGIVGSINFLVVGNPLPAGLSLDPLTGSISGTPIADSPATNYRIRAVPAGKTAVATDVNIEIGPPGPTAVSYSVPASFRRGQPISSVGPVVEGTAARSFTVSPPLPAGLSLNPTTGVISGTPTGLAPAADYTVTAVHPAGSVSKTIRIEVLAIPPSNLQYTVPAVLPRTIAMSPALPRFSGDPIVSYSVAPALPAGISLNPTTGAISGTPSANTVAANYVITATNSGGSASATIRFAVVDPPPTNLTYTVPVYFRVGETITPINPTYSAGPPTSYAVSPPLPAGLLLNAATGTISGKPTAAALATDYVITASNAGGSANRTINFFVRTSRARSAQAYRFLLMED